MKQTINLGTAPNNGTGDSLRVAGDKLNDNFTELYDGQDALTQSIVIAQADLNLLFPAVSRGRKIFVEAPATDVQIQAAIDALFSLGGGDVYLGVGTFTLATPVTRRSGVNIYGVTPRLENAPGFLAQQWIPAGGTQIVAGGALRGFVSNDINLANSSTWFSGYITNAHVQDMCFVGFTEGGLRSGASHAAGAQFSTFKNIAFYHCGSFGTSYSTNNPACLLENFSTINVENIWGSGCAGGFSALSGQTTQQSGNSNFKQIVWDTFDIPDASPAGSNPANFCRPVVIGGDPLVPTTAPHNQLMFDRIQVQTVQRITFSETTGTFAGGTNVPVQNVQRFPVGMPVHFTAASGNIQANRIYMVLTNPGGTGVGNITIGLSRTTAALTVPGSGTLTIRQAGYPALDLSGGNTQNVSSGSFKGLDIEGVSNPQIYCEGVSQSFVEILQTSTGQTNLCLRNCGLFFGNSVASVCIPDLDSGSANGAYLSGTFNAPIAGVGPGLKFDGVNSVNALQLSPSQSNGMYDVINAGNGAFLRANKGWGMKTTALVTGAGNLNDGGQLGGLWTMHSAGAQATTLLALNNTNIASSYRGLHYKMKNIGAGSWTISPSSNVAGQFINDATLVSNNVVLLQGQEAEFIGSVSPSSGTNRTFWTVITNGTIS